MCASVHNEGYRLINNTWSGVKGTFLLYIVMGLRSPCSTHVSAVEICGAVQKSLCLLILYKYFTPQNSTIIDTPYPFLTSKAVPKFDRHALGRHLLQNELSKLTAVHRNYHTHTLTRQLLHI